ncbi:MAG: membrane protein insertase YidC [Desulfuromonadales bacterium]|nr:membrane protein insertase YidC [Desulfuromonadales bacterium]
MENNRTILAIALIILVWSGYNMLFPPPQTEVVPQATVQQSESERVDKTDPVTAIKEEPVETSQSLPVAVENQKVRVESELYLFELTTNGARVRQAFLKKYKVENLPDAMNVALVDVDTDSLGSFKTSGKEGLFLPDNLSYALKENITQYQLSGQQSQDVVFIAKTSTGLEVHKIYTFYPESYLVDLKIKLINRAAQQVQGVLDLSLVTAWDDSMAGDMQEFVGPTTLSGEDVVEDDPDDLQTSAKVYGKGLVWSGFVTKYFASLVSPQEGAASKVYVEMGEGYVENRFSSAYLTLEPNESAGFEYVTYLGPKDYDILQSIGYGFDRAIDLGFFSIIGQPLMVVLKFFHNYLGNWGFAIILLTVCIKALFWPLTQKSYTSMQSMQKLQPQMTKLREKYSSDKQRLNQEMMALYKENRVNPFGGCLPILIQIPVFFALYQVLLGSIELRHAPFMLWITDLSAKDPYYITPLIMGGTMFLQQKMTPSNMDPTQARIMLMMPVVFTFLFLNFPSGLVIYWLVNNVLTIAQQYLIKRKAS